MDSPQLSSDRQITHLPRWLVRHVCRSENHKLMGKPPYSWRSAQKIGYAYTPSQGADRRLPAHYWQDRNNSNLRVGTNQRWDEAKRAWVTVPDAQVIRVTDFAPSSRSLIETIAHLDENDYRLWAEVRTRHAENGCRIIEARCRWCNQRYTLPAFNQVVRKTHKVNCNFTYNLRPIFEAMLKSGKCGVCGNHTPDQRWGIPICSPRCAVSWKFAEINSNEFHAAELRCGLLGLLILDEEGDDAHATLTYPAVP